MTSPVAVLRALTPDDLDPVVRWSRDEVFCRANGWEVDRPPASVRAHWLQLIVEPPHGLLRLGAEVDGELVGYADLADIDREQAELGFAIGDARRWGTGLGTATARAMITYGFEHLGLRRIRATAHETNERSVALLEKLGFQRVGTLPTAEEYLGELSTVLEFVLPLRPPSPGIRVISTMTGAGYLWRAWCERDGCDWKGPTRTGGLGGRQRAERDGYEHDSSHQGWR